MDREGAIDLGQEIEDSEAIDRPRRCRPSWTVIWRTPNGTATPSSTYTESLPSRVTVKNNTSRCNMHSDHIARGEASVAATCHSKRTIYTKCSSTRCEASSTPCRCRYKIVECEVTGFAVVYVQGVHTMLNSAATSPREPRLSAEMRAYVDSKMSDDSTIFPFLLFSLICEKVNDGVFTGPPPTQAQVQTYSKRWRKKHRDDTVQPVIEFCGKAMYGSRTNQFQNPNDLLVLCDVVDEEGVLAPNIGDGSDEDPLRLGITCSGLLEAYITVQSDPRCKTMLHIDSTHKTVSKRYSVFVMGISDPSGKYFPLVYYCSSQRTTDDIAWCLAFLKKVLRERYAVTFAPKYVMTDADDAQYNACSLELPATLILMCWFHVSQNIKDKTKKLDRVTREMIFRDFNRLHFSTSEEEYQQNKVKIIAAWRSAFSFCPRFKAVGQHLIFQWIETNSAATDRPQPSRFSKWQVFHSPPGYAATNNPLEQYHKTLKIVNNSDRATPIEMVQRLDRSRLAFLAKNISFSSTTRVSDRLKALYNRVKKSGALEATVIAPVGNLRLVRVVSKPRLGHASYDSGGAANFEVAENCESADVDADHEFHNNDVALPFKSPYTLQMLWDGMPPDGWIVDPVSKSCQCRFNFKYGMCLHVIEAAKLISVPCPGMPDPMNRFVSRTRTGRTRPRRRRRQRHREHGSDVDCNDTSAVDGVVYRPHLPSTSSADVRICPQRRQDLSCTPISTTTIYGAADDNSPPVDGASSAFGEASRMLSVADNSMAPISDHRFVPRSIHNPAVPRVPAPRHHSCTRIAVLPQDTNLSLTQDFVPSPQTQRTPPRQHSAQIKRRRH